MMQTAESERKLFAELEEKTVALGAYRAKVIPASAVVTDASFRDACARNACGMYGKCWTCPPDAGEIGELIAKLGQYRFALFYQTVGTLEDSFDFEGMQACAAQFHALVQKTRELFDGAGIADRLILGAGGCHACARCAKADNEPCRHPDLAVSSLETYGVYVAKTAEVAEMKYINGKDTVTYFGAVFFNL